MPGMMQSMRSQRVDHSLVTKQKPNGRINLKISSQENEGVHRHTRQLSLALSRCCDRVT